MNRALGVSAGLILLLALLEACVSTTCSGLGNDSAVYWSVAWARVLGHQLYQQVVCSYPPGVPVILSALGRNICNPYLVHSLLFATHLANGVALFLIIRTMGLSRRASAFLVSIFVTLVIHLDGLSLVLEPFQNLFILAAFLTLRKSWTGPATLATGCLVTLSVLMKQFSVLYIPIFGYAAYAGSMRQDPVAPTGSESRKNLGWFLLGLVLPYSLYVLMDQQNFYKLLVHLATFGGSSYYAGQGAGSYAAIGTDTSASIAGRALEILIRLFQPTYMLIPGFLCLAVLLLWMRRARLSLLLCWLFAASLAPMAIRGFLHYAQLAAPWQILMAAQVFAQLGRERFQKQAMLMSLMLICASPFIYINLKIARAEWATPSLRPQQAMARVIQDIVPDGQTISLEGLGYLYPLAQRNPPGWDFESSFYDVTGSQADFIAVYSPGLEADDNERKELNRVLATGRFTHIQTQRYNDGAFRVGRVLFFKRV